MPYLLSRSAQVIYAIIISYVFNVSVVCANYNTQDIDVSGIFVVPVPFINTGSIFVIGAGSINGDLLDAASLAIGKSKNGVLDPNNFVASGNIGGTAEINIFNGSSFTSSHLISGVSRKFYVDTNAAATLNRTIIGSGEFENHGTVFFTGPNVFSMRALYNLGNLNISDAFTVPSQFTNTGNIYVTGAAGNIIGSLPLGQSLNIGIASDGTVSPNNFIYNGNIINVPLVNIAAGSSFAINADTNFVTDAKFSGAGILQNNGTMTLNPGANIVLDNFVNAGTLNIKNSFNVPGFFGNTGSIYVTGSGEIIGDISGGASFNIGIDSAGNNLSNTLHISSTLTNFDFINVKNGLLTTSDTSNLSGIGDLYIAKNATAVFNGNYSSDGVVVNEGVLYINKGFSADTIVNKNAAKLYLQATNNILATHIVNDGGAILNIASDVNMPGMSFLNNGIVSIMGKNTITADNYISPGAHNFSIKNDDMYSSLHANNDIDFSDGTINISSKFLGGSNKKYSWNVVSASNIITNNNTTINLPESSLFLSWSSDVGNSGVTVNFIRAPFGSVDASNNAELSKVLDGIADMEISGACEFMSCMASCNRVEEWNQKLEKLKPVARTNVHNVAMQNASFNKVEMRIASQNNHSSMPSGITSGDINATNSIWVSGFGSVANQKNTASVIGYQATAAGMLMGLDQHNNLGSIYGVALGWSNSNIDQTNVPNAIDTRIIGYNALLYGAIDLNKTNFFEYLVTGIINYNTSSRIINLLDTDYNLISNYHGWQGGFRFNLGQHREFNAWKFSYIETLRYIMLQQPGYTEVGGPIALQVASSGIGNILTLGLGSRMSAINSNPWLSDTRELRAMITYDVITTDNSTTANFIVGGSDFTISNSAARLALQLGATYSFTLMNKMFLECSYDFEVRSKYTDNSGSIKLRYVF